METKHWMQKGKVCQPSSQRKGGGGVKKWRSARERAEGGRTGFPMSIKTKRIAC
jgi:hypothetical protein